MNYIDFQKEIQKKHGALFSEIVELFFEKAVKLADQGKIEDAIHLSDDLLVLSKYSNVGYGFLYIIGMTCQLYLDNDQPELSDEFFKQGMKIINESDIKFDSYESDINTFLDLKALIDKDLKDNSL